MEREAGDALCDCLFTFCDLMLDDRRGHWRYCSETHNAQLCIPFFSSVLPAPFFISRSLLNEAVWIPTFRLSRFSSCYQPNCRASITHSIHIPQNDSPFLQELPPPPQQLQRSTAVLECIKLWDLFLMGIGKSKHRITMLMQSHAELRPAAQTVQNPSSAMHQHCCRLNCIL